MFKFIAIGLPVVAAINVRQTTPVALRSPAPAQGLETVEPRGVRGAETTKNTEVFDKYDVYVPDPHFKYEVCDTPGIDTDSTTDDSETYFDTDLPTLTEKEDERAESDDMFYSLADQDEKNDDHEYVNFTNYKAQATAEEHYKNEVERENVVNDTEKSSSENYAKVQKPVHTLAKTRIQREHNQKRIKAYRKKMIIARKSKSVEKETNMPTAEDLKAQADELLFAKTTDQGVQNRIWKHNLTSEDRQRARELARKAYNLDKDILKYADGTKSTSMQYGLFDDLTTNYSPAGNDRNPVQKMTPTFNFQDLRTFANSILCNGCA